MSQKSRRLKSSQNTKLDNTQDDNVNEELVNKCVRYILTKMGTNIPIKKADIMKQALTGVPHKTFEKVIAKAIENLKDVYGLNLESLESELTKKYVVTNLLQHVEELRIQDKDIKKIITFLVLTHIFMSKNSATDLSLWKFLNEFNITPDMNIDEMETVQHFITKTLVKQHYICHEARGGEHDDGQLKVKFVWGSHAEQCVSKMNLLKFVSSMYDNENLALWKDQYEDALQQLEDYEAME